MDGREAGPLERDGGGGQLVSWYEETREGLSSMRSPEGIRQSNDGESCLQAHQVMRGHTRARPVGIDLGTSLLQGDMLLHGYVPSWIESGRGCLECAGACSVLPQLDVPYAPQCLVVFCFTGPFLTRRDPHGRLHMVEPSMERSMHRSITLWWRRSCP